MDDRIDQIITAFNEDLPPGWEIRLEHDGGGATIFSTRSIDGRVLGGPVIPTGVEPDPATVITLLRDMQGELIEHALGYAWPRCLIHGSHPMRPELDGWHCPADPVDDRDPQPSRGHFEFGSLSRLPPPPEPDRGDGEVRWYLDDLGWGVIAHGDGDLFVHFSSIAGEGYRSLVEGERVTFDVDPGSQGMFRRADHVHPVGP